MKKNYYLFFLVSILFYNQSNCGFLSDFGFFEQTKKWGKTLGHWTLSAGPQIIQAVHYVSLLSEEYAMEIFGDQNASREIEEFARHVLGECGVEDPEKIKIKIIKGESQNFVLSAVVCTESILFINNSIFSYLPKNEQRALIAQAGVMMQQKHVSSNAITMAMIPLLTHALTEIYKIVSDQIYDGLSDNLKNNVLVSKIHQGNDFVAGFWATKLLINSFIAAKYFKHMSQHYDVESAKIAGTAKDLMQYYIRSAGFKDRENKTIFNISKPSLRERISYLLPLVREQSKDNSN